MNAVVSEWVAKAEEDFAVALREHRVKKAPAHGAVCFHAQQCIEKYFKAILTERRVAFSKTHDLLVLLTACLSHFPLWGAMTADVKRLSSYAVRFRYPGETADREDAEQAVRIMRAVRAELLQGLGLPKAKRAGGQWRKSRAAKR